MTRKLTCEIRPVKFHRVGEVQGCIYGRFRGILSPESSTGRVSAPASRREMANRVKRHRGSSDTVARETIGRFISSGRGQSGYAR